MKRHTTAVTGWVRFPISNPDWQHQGGGGTLVKLVVCDNREFDDQFSMCCGASITDLLSESFVGDDRRPRPTSASAYDSVEAVQAEQKAIFDWEAYHFPRIGDTELPAAEQYMSRDYLAAMVLGTTGWAGWHDEEGKPWHCQFADLTDEGKALYRQIESLYPGCELHLLTFLDT